MLSELQARINVDEWWASERPRIAVLFPQRCDEVIAQTTVAMQRAKDEGHAQILADAAAMCARAYTGQGEAENGARLIHEMLSGAEHQFINIERAPLIAALGVAYESLGNYGEALDLLHDCRRCSGVVRAIARSRRGNTRDARPRRASADHQHWRHNLCAAREHARRLVAR